jgi:hypothetical protein
LKLEPPVINYTFEEYEENDGGGELDLDVGAIDFGDVSLAAGDGIELETGQFHNETYI